MNKYNLKEFLQDSLKDCKSTFKDTSYDDIITKEVGFFKINFKRLDCNE